MEKFKSANYETAKYQMSDLFIGGLGKKTVDVRVTVPFKIYNVACRFQTEVS